MLDNDFRELRAELRKRGYYQKPTATMLVELGIHVLVAAGGLVLFLAASGWVVRVCGLIVWTAGSIGIGTNTHTSSHNATCDKRWVNQLLTYLGYPVYFGLSATYWCHKHVLVHHSAPNVMGVDNDADLSPLFATTMDEVRQSQGVRRFYYEHLQRFVFPAAVSMTLFGQQIAGCAYLVRSLRGSAGRTAHLVDAGALLAHVVTTLLIPMFFFRPAEVAVFYLVRNVLLSYAMFAVFAPAHFPQEAARLDKDLSKVNYPLAVTATTLDFRVGWFGRRMCSGLEYQIEHHLLPDISHRHYPAISGVVQEFCREHGLPYRQHGWGRAVWRSLSAIRTPGEVVRNL